VKETEQAKEARRVKEAKKTEQDKGTGESAELRNFKNKNRHN
jgi:hypothetical protein